MTLTEAIEAYITLKRSLGAVFCGYADSSFLRSCDRRYRCSGHRPGDDPVSSVAAKERRREWERKDETLRGFFAWLVNRGHLAACPLPAHRPRVCVRSSPTSIPAMNQSCGIENASLEIAHVVPIAKGGRHDLDNLALLCAPHLRRSPACRLVPRRRRCPTLPVGTATTSWIPSGPAGLSSSAFLGTSSDAAPTTTMW